MLFLRRLKFENEAACDIPLIASHLHHENLITICAINVIFGYILLTVQIFIWVKFGVQVASTLHTGHVWCNWFCFQNQWTKSDESFTEHTVAK